MPKKKSRKEQRKVAFVGGPADGHCEWMPLEEVDHLIWLVPASAEGVVRPVIYKHSYAHTQGKDAPLKVEHRYVFVGHNPRPEDL